MRNGQGVPSERQGRLVNNVNNMITPPVKRKFEALPANGRVALRRLEDSRSNGFTSVSLGEKRQVRALNVLRSTCCIGAPGARISNRRKRRNGGYFIAGDPTVSTIKNARASLGGHGRRLCSAC